MLQSNSRWPYEACRFGSVANRTGNGHHCRFLPRGDVTRHDEPIVVIHNATDETLRRVCITEDFHRGLDGIPEGTSYTLDELQPHHTWTERLSSHRSTVLDVRATTAGKELSSEKVSVASQGVLLALVSSDGITFTPPFR